MQTDTTKNLSPEQVKAIEALLTEGNKAAAARVAGVDRSTLYRWMTSDANFQAALEEATAEMLKEFSRGLVRLADKAIGALEAALGSRQRIAVRLRAADIVTARLLAVRELVDLEGRLSALEGSANEAKN